MFQDQVIQLPDSRGDRYSPLIQAYVNDDTEVDHLQQLVLNYESAFDESPSSREDLLSALRFIEYFLLEISETSDVPDRKRAASTLLGIVDSIDISQTLKNLAFRLEK